MEIINASYFKHRLVFLKPARTSRNVMEHHDVYILKLESGNRIGYGEAAPLPGLSTDPIDKIEAQLQLLCTAINESQPEPEQHTEGFPALAFAYETAKRSVQFKTPFTVFENDFQNGKGIPINGLVWMDSLETMFEQAFQKIADGYTCIKLKVGAWDFDAECRLLESIRKRYNPFQLELRLDANGAFENDVAMEQLHTLSRFDIHSIEQPIKAKQLDIMEELCRATPIPIALDEELIGMDVYTKGASLLKRIKPAYIILKPTLLGGFERATTWIQIANQHNTGWWATSALESNIGLNAIAQWTYDMKPQIPQGLGTGSLYANNFVSPLSIQRAQLSYQKNITWQISVYE